MAGAATVTSKIYITGLGTDAEATNSSTVATPVEFMKQYNIISVPLNLDTGNITLTAVYGLWLKAEVGTLYVKLNDTSTAVTLASAETVLSAGASDYYSINPANNAGIRIGGSAASAAVSYVVLGK